MHSACKLLPAEPVAEGVLLARCFRERSESGSVSMVIVKSAALAIVDTGESPCAQPALVDALSRLDTELTRVDFIANTHGHADHIGANSAIQTASGARVWYPADEPLGVGVGRQPVELARGGDTLDLGRGRTLVAIPAAGHTKGSIAWYSPEVRVLIAGDAVQGPGSSTSCRLPAYFDSGESYRASLVGFLSLDIDAMVIGHPLAWSRGSRQSVHRGPAVGQFIVESLEASYAVADAVGRGAAGARCNGIDAALRKAVARELVSCHALFRDFPSDRGLSPRSDGTLLAELRDQGLLGGPGTPHQ